MTKRKRSHENAAVATAPPPRQEGKPRPAVKGTPLAFPWLQFPYAPLGLTALFAAFLAVPRVWNHPTLRGSFVACIALLLTWTGILWNEKRTSGRSFVVEWFPPIKNHYIQGSVQICLYIYWGWYWRDVYSEAPLFVAQFIFLYTLDALLSWSRGKHWRLGLGPLPIILSVNVFIWFRDEWFYFQFVLVALGALGKEFIQWERNGKRSHIFNPSAFTLAVFSIALLATGTTNNTWGLKIAASISYPPYIYLYIFCLGIIVQYFFAVTLMTLSAVAALVLLNLGYFGLTGTYYFVSSNLPVPIFVGLHLLMTDPATTPRSNFGKILFGTLYGSLSFVLYGVLNHFHLPTIYDKLLPIPILNAGVKIMDRAAEMGIVRQVAGWFPSVKPKMLNYIHMGCWTALFLTMRGTGYIEAPHEGNTIQFWRTAIAESRPGAEQGLVEMLEFQAREGSAGAWNELGLIHMKGSPMFPRDPGRAARCFARASKLGDLEGSVNLVNMFMSAKDARPSNDIFEALDRLEDACAKGARGRIHYLIGFAYEFGRGRPADRVRAVKFYESGCNLGDADACEGLKRVKT